jgi:hypothetical protein
MRTKTRFTRVTSSKLLLSAGYTVIMSIKANAIFLLLFYFSLAIKPSNNQRTLNPDYNDANQLEQSNYLSPIQDAYYPSDSGYYRTRLRANNAKLPINILLLLPDNETYKFSLNKVKLSLELAIHEIKHTDYGEKFDVVITTGLCDCTAIKAPVDAMENVYNKKNHTKLFQAIFGPSCD